jgi:RimJ/RimL family protein N-acetyltransferase
MAAAIVVRPATEDDYGQINPLVDAVAAEGRWIGSEPPIDHEGRRKYREERADDPERFAAFVAEADGTIVGHLTIEKMGYGVAELGMLVGESWRGRGVGSALLEAAIAWARGAGAHKVGLQRWPHNERAAALYEKYGFVEEGRLVRHYRRKNGELWDAVIMGLVLDHDTPGSPYS